MQDASAILDELPQDALTEEAVPGVQGFEFGSIVGICSFELCSGLQFDEHLDVLSPEPQDPKVRTLTDPQGQDPD